MGTIEAEYVLSLESDDRLTSAQRTSFTETWALLASKEPSIMYPSCGVDEDDHAFYMGWNTAERGMEVQISSLGERSWFYSEHASRTSPCGDSDDGFLKYVPFFKRSA